MSRPSSFSLVSGPSLLLVSSGHREGHARLLQSLGSSVTTLTAAPSRDTPGPAPRQTPCLTCGPEPRPALPGNGQPGVGEHGEARESAGVTQAGGPSRRGLARGARFPYALAVFATNHEGEAEPLLEKHGHASQKASFSKPPARQATQDGDVCHPVIHRTSPDPGLEEAGAACGWGHVLQSTRSGHSDWQRPTPVRNGSHSCSGPGFQGQLSSAPPVRRAALAPAASHAWHQEVSAEGVDGIKGRAIA